MDYKNINRQAWNLKTTVHVSSGFYDNESFLSGRNTLNSVEHGLLGDVNGKSVLHLQCHFGQDSISLSRLGAKVTGVDISDTAITQARRYASLLGTDTRFICSDIYELPGVLEETFDIVFTSYGVTGWLPDMDRWANTVSCFLRPGGMFVMVEFHPFLWMFDGDLQKPAFSYFNDGPIVEQAKGTYACPGAEIEYSTVTWNHSLGEIIGALIASGIGIDHFGEYDFSPYSCFPGMESDGEGNFRVAGWGNKAPLLFSVRGNKG